jgi:hypothetical protein
MSTERDGLARSVQVRLAQHARAINVDPNLVLTRYAVERFLYRLSCSRHAATFALKGALLLLVWLGETLRPTRDADLLGFGDVSDDALVQIFKDVCALPVEPDSMVYVADSVRLAPIRMEDAYGGRRVTVLAYTGAARVTVQVDVGIGDAVTPAPQWLDYPSLLDMPRPRLRAYPRETVIAEKVHAMVVLGMRNSRMKDYFDVDALLREGEFDAPLLAQAIANTFARRRTPVPNGVPQGLSDAFAVDAGKQAQWKAFLARNRLDDHPLEEVVAAIRASLLAPLTHALQSNGAG